MLTSLLCNEFELVNGFIRFSRTQHHGSCRNGNNAIVVGGNICYADELAGNGSGQRDGGYTCRTCRNTGFKSETDIAITSVIAAGKVGGNITAIEGGAI